MAAIFGLTGSGLRDFAGASRQALARMDGRGGPHRHEHLDPGAAIVVGCARTDPAGCFALDAAAGVCVACDGEVRVPGLAEPRAGSPSVLGELARGYREQRERLFSRLRGSFALAFWDLRDGSIALVRDRAGSKPLFWAATRSGWAFASEIAPLRATGGIDTGVDPTAIDTFLDLTYVPAPHTFYRGISQVCPGGWLRLAPGASPAGGSCVAAMPARLPLESWRETIPELRRRLQGSVAAAVAAHPEAGFLLSAGTDTAALLGSAAAARVRPLRTFTLGFPEDPKLDETVEARRTAAHYGAEHVELSVDRSCLGHLEEVTRRVGAPVGNPAALISRTLFAAVGRHLDAVVCADGGNEIFGGTYKYNQVMACFQQERGRLGRLVAWSGQRAWRLVEDTRFDPWFQTLARAYFRRRPVAAPVLPLAADRARCRFAASYYALINSLWTDANRRRLYRDGLGEVVAAGNGDGHPLDLFRFADDGPFLQQLPCVRVRSFIPFDVMPYVEYNAVAGGVLPLFPLLDEDLVEFMLRVPYEIVFGCGYRHYMEQALAPDLVPREVFRRPHKGFKPPLASWLRASPGRDLMADALSPEAVARRGLLEPVLVGQLMRRFLAGEKYLATEHPGRAQPLAESLWSLIALETWFRQQ